MPPSCVRISVNAQWPPIIDAVLGEQGGAQKQARYQMWNEVGFFVERILELPIGRLNEDPDARRDIAVNVLAKLEANNFAHIREWRRRQRLRCDHASWWTWIRTIARRTAIDFARLHPENVGRRGEAFSWVRVEPIDPAVLNESVGVGSSSDPGSTAEMLRNSLAFLGSADEDTLADHLTHVQASLTDEDTFAVKLGSTLQVLATADDDCAE
jgi:hypothetical protein